MFDAKSEKQAAFSGPSAVARPHQPHGLRKPLLTTKAPVGFVLF